MFTRSDLELHGELVVPGSCVGLALLQRDHTCGSAGKLLPHCGELGSRGMVPTVCLIESAPMS
eukprot:scaffold86583_cov26-Tisochrysis_lutea.AAC.1